MTYIDPLDSLDAAAASPPQPKATQPQGGNGLTLFVIGLLIGVLGMAFYQKQTLPDDGRRQDGFFQQDEDEQGLSGGTLVFIFEKVTPTPEQAALMRGIPAFVEKHKLDGFAALDDDDTDPQTRTLKEYGAGRGIEPPLVIRVVDGEPKSAAPWPKDEASLEKFIQ